MLRLKLLHHHRHQTSWFEKGKINFIDKMPVNFNSAERQFFTSCA
jgi:hypothetical protein